MAKGKRLWQAEDWTNESRPVYKKSLIGAQITRYWAASSQKHFGAVVL